MKTKMSLIFASGVVAGSSLFGGGALAAQNYWRYIKVMNENLKLDVNGVSVHGANLLDYNQTVYAPVNAVAQALGGTALWSKWLPGVNLVHFAQLSPKGTVVIQGNIMSGVHPILLDGKAYVPASSVASALAVSQSFNAKTQTEYFGPEPSGALLTEIMSPYHWTGFQGNLANTSSGGWGNNMHMKMGGVTYNNGIQINVNATLNAPLEPAIVYYNLQSRYKKLTGLIGLDDTSSSPSGEKFEFFGNGKLVYSINLKPAQLPQTFSIDVSDIKQLVLEAAPLPSSQGGVIADLANLRLY